MLLEYERAMHRIASHHFLRNLRRIIIRILPIIFALHLLNDRLHFLLLPLPLLLSHLRLASEELLVWLTVTAAESVPQGRELAVVVVEVEVVHCVACSSVEDWGVGNVFAVVD